MPKKTEETSITNKSASKKTVAKKTVTKKKPVRAKVKKSVASGEAGPSKKAPAKKAPAKKTTAKKAPAKKATKKSSSSTKVTELAGVSQAVVISAEERHLRIQTAAYFRAMERGFEPGHEESDWLWAEHLVDSELAPRVGS